MSNKQEKEFYKSEDLAEKLDVNIMTIYRYIKAGRLKAHKIGKEFRIEQKEFLNFLKNTKTK
ncbi:MAG: helix-turn-helix domain-containing protein [Candidatus Pacebacteria bacterium]|nr:helix-turn-helix domain-containing protein [Candidatus Paceibacterota bacterium]